MYPLSFDYFSPKSLSEALELYDGSPENKILAGGQSLIPSLKLRSVSLKGVVDITGIRELDYIRKNKNLLGIGALTTTAILEDNQLIASSVPILKEASGQIADPLVRNRGTVGGNLCYSDPVYDLPAVMLALNAHMVMVSKNGTRKIHADSFFIDSFKTALKPGEILTEVEVPLPRDKSGGAYCKVKRGSGGYSIAGVAICISIAKDEDDIISECRIGLTGVGPKALRPEKAEQALLKKVPTPSILDKVAALAVKGSTPLSDHIASEDYRRKVLFKLVKDAVEIAYRRANGEK